MAWIADEYAKFHGWTPGVVTGKPVQLGGSLGRGAATGRGVLIATTCLLEDRGEALAGKAVAIQGFGNVGSWAARLFAEQGARIVAVSDITGGIRNRDGLDVDALIAHVGATGGVSDFAGGDNFAGDALLVEPCDVLIPAALEEQITPDNVERLQCKLIVEGANGPTTPEADEALAVRGIPVIPDIFANAGGVTVSYFEWVQNIQQLRWSEERVNSELERILREAWGALKREGASGRGGLRGAAYRLAIRRVAEATKLRS
jgi:glutamate dehydrogenase (NAD(P)+)